MSTYRTLQSLNDCNYANVIYGNATAQSACAVENFIVLPQADCAKYGKKKCILHNPKTGGTSLNDIFNDNPNIYRAVGHAFTQNNDNEVVVIRNPIERFKSAINFMRYSGFRHNTKYLQNFTTFVDMMKNTSLEKLYDEVLNRDLVFTPQLYWIGNKSTILCYEKGLENEFRDKLNVDVKFPKLNTKDNCNPSEDRAPTEEEREFYWKDSDAVVNQVVNHFYKEDIEIYNQKC